MGEALASPTCLSAQELSKGLGKQGGEGEDPLSVLRVPPWRLAAGLDQAPRILTPRRGPTYLSPGPGSSAVSVPGGGGGI